MKLKHLKFLLCLGATSGLLAQSDLDAGRLLPLFEESTPLAFAYWLVWPKGRTLTQPLRAFMNWVREEAKKETATAAAA